MSAREILLVIKAAVIPTVSANTNKTILTIALISLIVIGGTEKYSGADMVSMDSSFGSDTITYDYTAGHRESGSAGGPVIVAAIGADSDPTMTERPSFEFVTSDNINNSHGSWLSAKAVFFMPSIQLLLLPDSGLQISGTWTGDG
jgi:hypothetical protein